MRYACRLFIAVLVFGCGPATPADGGMTGECARACDDGVFCNGAERCAPDDPAADADGCAPALEEPCATADRCDEAGRTCGDPTCATMADADGDGVDSVACGGEDCDDDDPTRFGGNEETCDEADEDCDPSTLAPRGGEGDRDGDGFAIPACCNPDDEGGTRCGTDCDDAREDRRGSAVEVCDGIDNDCDEAIDEGVRLDLGVDDDHDRSGAPEAVEQACFPSPGLGVIVVGAGIDDCDDADPEVSPMHLEVCDGADSDCDGDIDEGCACDEGDARRCEACGLESFQRCEGGLYGRCEVAATEVCNGGDDDCDARIDEGFPTVLCFHDDDDDGFAPVGARQVSVCMGTACPDEFGFTGADRAPVGPDAVDCDDEDASRHPGAAELCNGVNDDCDSAIDEGC